MQYQYIKPSFSKEELTCLDRPAKPAVSVLSDFLEWVAADDDAGQDCRAKLAAVKYRLEDPNPGGTGR